MTARLIDGIAISRGVLGELKARVAALKARGMTPGLAAVLIGANPASEVYVRNKTAACLEVGLHSELHRLEAEVSEREVIALIARLNDAPHIHGILIQLPLSPHLSAERILQTVRPDKDVDGFHWLNLGALVAGAAALAPCTPLGVMTMLDREGIAVEGRNAVVVGRSTIVGKPAALMLIGRGATVTVCNSKTSDLARHTALADILIVAVGKESVVNGSMIKPGAVVIDVGINRRADGKLTGDVDFASACEVASRITPVPGGVGRMTVAMLIGNTVAAAAKTLTT